MADINSKLFAILSRADNAVAALNELCQAGLLCLTNDIITTPCGDGWEVEMVVHLVDGEISIRGRGVGSRKSTGKHNAAADCLRQIAEREFVSGCFMMVN